MIDQSMTKEAWRLAATLLSQDGLDCPALLLWRESDDAVKLSRLARSPACASPSEIIKAGSLGFDFDHAILLVRTDWTVVHPVGTQPPEAPAPSIPAGVTLTYLSRDGHSSVFCASPVEADGCLSLSEPVSLQMSPNSLNCGVAGNPSVH